MPATQRKHLSLAYSVLSPHTESDRRAHERLTVSALSWLDSVRLKYGPAVSLIDLSAGGAQIETVSHRLQPGSTVAIEIAGRSGDLVIPSRVIRCHVTALAPHPTYRGALEFKRLITLPSSDPVSCMNEEINPVHEHARLMVVLRRVTGSLSGDRSPVAVSTEVGVASLAGAMALIESPAGRRAGTPFARELSRLFRTITAALERGDDDSHLLAELTERLRRAVPARSLRLLESPLPVLQTQDAISIDVRTGGSSPSKLLVEFPRSCRLEEWHLQLLKAGAHLITLVKEVKRGRELAEQRAREEVQLSKPGWHRLVARYRDGRMLKGFGRDFSPATGHVPIWPTPDAPPAARITVCLVHLKAVFFVHNFDGAEPGSGAAGATSYGGRSIEVTFHDGEVLSGTTLNYSADGPGFFVIPASAETNNQRVFVVGSAVRHVRFP